MAPIRVVVVEDHPIVREGLRRLLNDAVGIEVVGEARRGAEALALARDLRPDVLLLDLELPGSSGLQVIEQLRYEDLPVRVLVLSAHDSIAFVRAVIRLGVYGYLLKEEELDKIVAAVRGVARGERNWFSRRIAARIPEAARRPLYGLESLTGRERDVLRELAQAKSNQEIAEALNISPKTVEKHVEAIFEKLEFVSRVEAAVLAVEQGF